MVEGKEHKPIDCRIAPRYTRLVRGHSSSRPVQVSYLSGIDIHAIQRELQYFSCIGVEQEHTPGTERDIDQLPDFARSIAQAASYSITRFPILIKAHQGSFCRIPHEYTSFMSPYLPAEYVDHGFQVNDSGGIHKSRKRAPGMQVSWFRPPTITRGMEPLPGNAPHRDMGFGIEAG